MKRFILITSLAGLMTGLAVGMPAQADPPPWAPAYGHRAREVEVVHEYRYVYYPEQQVYYAPETHNWFWLNGNVWQAGLSLPSGLYVNVSNGGVALNLNSPRPYMEHAYVEEHYGRPWREERRHHEERREHEEHRQHEEWREHHGPDRW